MRRSIAMRGGAGWTALAALAFLVMRADRPLLARDSAADQRPRMVLQTGHTETVVVTTFNFDGSLLATASTDGAVMLWSVQTGQKICEMVDRGAPITCLAFSHDGKSLVTGSQQGGVVIWSVATGDAVRHLQTNSKTSVAAVSLSSDDTALTALEATAAVRTWDPRTGKVLADAKEAGWQAGQIISALALCPGGRRAATAAARPQTRSAMGRHGRPWISGTMPMSIEIWNPKTGAVEANLGQREGGVNTMTFSPDGRQLALDSNEAGVELWDVCTGELAHTLDSRDRGATSLAYSADGKLLATGSQSGTVIWSAETGERVLTVVDANANRNRYFMRNRFRYMNYYYNQSESLAFSPDSRLLAIADSEKITLWIAPTGETDRTLAGRNYPVLCALFSPDGKRIGLASSENAAILDATTGQQVCALAAPGGGIGSLAFSPDGAKAVSSGQGSNTIEWDASTGQQIRALETEYWQRSQSALFSPDGKQIAAAWSQGGALIWDTRQTNPVARVVSTTPAPVQTNGGFMMMGMRFYGGNTTFTGRLAYTPDGKQLVTFGAPNNSGQGPAGTPELWDLSKPAAKKLRDFTTQPASFIVNIALSPDGKQLAGMSNLGSLVFWDLQTGRMTRTTGDAKPRPPIRRRRGEAISLNRLGMMSRQTAETPTLAYSPDGKRLVAGYADAPAVLWDAQTGERIRDLDGDCSRICQTAFSRDGRFLLANCAGGSAGLWETATGRQLATLLLSEEGREWLIVTPDGFFDGSDRGRRMVAFRQPGQFKLTPGDKVAEFHRPGLLADLLSGKSPQ